MPSKPPKRSFTYGFPLLDAMVAAVSVATAAAVVAPYVAVLAALAASLESYCEFIKKNSKGF